MFFIYSKTFLIIASLWVNIAIKTAMLTQKDAEFEIYDFNTVFWWLKVILPMQRHYQI